MNEYRTSAYEQRARAIESKRRQRETNRRIDVLAIILFVAYILAIAGVVITSLIGSGMWGV